MTMFSSSPFPELPFSPNVFIPPNLLFDSEKDCACFNSGDPFISGGCFFHPKVTENVSTIKQDFVGQQQKFSEEPAVLHSFGDQDEHQDHYGLLEAVVSCSKSKKKTLASEKDGHGKIYTARGLRDRRVRLSIEISRKFFCLQDLLGFDKASKTLDWLFVESKKAIKELVDETSHCSSSTVNDQSNVEFLESIKGDSDEDEGKKKKCVDGKKKKMSRKSVAGFEGNHVVRDQSRAMARARARERTREKMNTKKLNY